MVRSANQVGNPHLTPVLIFGTGIHNQWLQDEPLKSLGLEYQARLLRSWPALLREVSIQLRISHEFHTTLCEEMPTVQWEKLIHAYCARHPQQLRAFEAETVLKRTVSQIIKQAQKELTPAIEHEKMLILGSVIGEHTVSLNMDNLLGHPMRVGSRAIKKAKHDWLEHPGGKIWFPHGSVERYAQITFGLRAYGKLPHIWQDLFTSQKIWERARQSKAGANGPALSIEQLTGAIKLEKKSPSRSLMGHLMLAPLIIFGASLSREEWGLWWLLNQRARNLARVPEHLRPPTRIILHKQEERLSFWCTKPANIEPLIAKNWPHAWTELINWMSVHKDLAGEFHAAD